MHLKAKSLAGPAAAFSADTSPRTYPLNTFLGHGLHRPSERVGATINLFYSLANRARDLGLRSWHVLPPEELPKSWKALRSPRIIIYHGESDNHDVNHGYPLSYAAAKAHLPMLSFDSNGHNVHHADNGASVDAVPPTKSDSEAPTPDLTGNSSNGSMPTAVSDDSPATVDLSPAPKDVTCLSKKKKKKKKNNDRKGSGRATRRLEASTTTDTWRVSKNTRSHTSNKARSGAAGTLRRGTKNAAAPVVCHRSASARTTDFLRTVMNSDEEDEAFDEEVDKEYVEEDVDNIYDDDE